MSAPLPKAVYKSDERADRRLIVRVAQRLLRHFVTAHEQRLRFLETTRLRQRLAELALIFAPPTVSRRRRLRRNVRRCSRFHSRALPAGREAHAGRRGGSRAESRRGCTRPKWSGRSRPDHATRKAEVQLVADSFVVSSTIQWCCSHGAITERSPGGR